jgi:hypothetical protein
MHDSRIVSLSFLALNESLATVMSLAVNYGEAPNLFREDMNISKEASWIMGGDIRRGNKHYEPPIHPSRSPPPHT